MPGILDDLQPDHELQPNSNLKVLKRILLWRQLILRGIFLLAFGVLAWFLDYFGGHILGAESIWLFFFQLPYYIISLIIWWESSYLKEESQKEKIYSLLIFIFVMLWIVLSLMNPLFGLLGFVSNVAQWLGIPFIYASTLFYLLFLELALNIKFWVVMDKRQLLAYQKKQS